MGLWDTPGQWGAPLLSDIPALLFSSVEQDIGNCQILVVLTTRWLFEKHMLFSFFQEVLKNNFPFVSLVTQKICWGKKIGSLWP